MSAAVNDSQATEASEAELQAFLAEVLGRGYGPDQYDQEVAEDLSFSGVMVP